MKQVQIIGNLGADCNVKHDANLDKYILNFQVAVNSEILDRSTGEVVEETTWFSVGYFVNSNKLAQYLKKGRQVFVQGSLRLVTYFSKKHQENRQGLQIKAVKIQLLGKSNSEESQNQPINGHPVHEDNPIPDEYQSDNDTDDNPF